VPPLNLFWQIRRADKPSSALVDSSPGHQDSKRELLALFFHFRLPKSS